MLNWKTRKNLIKLKGSVSKTILNLNEAKICIILFTQMHILASYYSVGLFSSIGKSNGDVKFLGIRW
jgi:hypothetical protein